MAALSTIFAIASVAFSVVAAKMQKDRAKKAAKETQDRADRARGLELTVENTVLALAIPYGRCKVGGARTLVFVPDSPVGLSSVSSPLTRTPWGFMLLGTLDSVIASFPNVGAINYSVSDSDGKNNRTFSNTNLRGDGRYISKDDRRKNFHQVLILQQAISVGGINQIIFPIVDGKRWDSVGQAPCVHINTFCDGNVVDPLVAQYGYTNNYFSDTAYASGGFWIEDGKYYDVQFSGVPDIQFLLEGLMVSYIELLFEGPPKLFQFTNKSYSNNPALCLLDYLTNTRYGLSVKTSEIDLESFYNAMLICEAPVLLNAPKNGLFWANNPAQRDIKRFECNIVLSSETAIRTNINKILDSMDMAELIWSGGKYKLQLKYPTLWESGHAYSQGQVVQAQLGNSYDIYRSLYPGNNAPLFDIDDQLNTDFWAYDTVAHITDDDIILSKEFSLSFPNAQTRYNCVTVRFRNEALDFVDDTAKWPSPNSTVYDNFLREDSSVRLETEIYAEAITDSYHAFAKAEQLCRTSRTQDILKLSLAGHLNSLEPGDIVHFLSEILNIPGRLYMVSTAHTQPDNSIEVTMNGFDARMLAWNAPDEAVITPISYVPEPLAQATNASYNPTTYTLAWTAAADSRVSYYNVFYTNTPIGSVNSGTTWRSAGISSLNSMRLSSGISPGTYTFAIVATTGSGQLAEQDGWPKVTGEVSTGIVNIPEPVITLIDVTVYKRDSSLPSKPTTGTYSFDTMSLSVIPAGWFISIPTGTAPIWQTVGVVEHAPGATTFDMSNAWTDVAEYSGADPDTGTVAVLSPDAVVVLQDYYGNNFGYDGAVGVFQVFIDGTEETQTSEVTYSVISEVDCTVIINNITGVNKGKFEVTDLQSNLGTAVLRAVIDSVSYDRTLSISILNEGYVLDPTEPPAAESSNVATTTGINHLVVELVTLPSYLEGHGHGKAIVYYCGVPIGDPTPDFADSTLLGEFMQGNSESFIFDYGVPLQEYDHYIWITYFSNDGYEGPPSDSIQIAFSKITTSDIEEYAVTLPISAESFSSLLPLELPSTDFGGADTLVTVHASGLLVNTAGESAAMEIRLDNTLIHTIPMLVGTQEIGAIPMASGSFTYFDGPGAGEHVYKLTVTGLDSILHQSITVVGLKR